VISVAAALLALPKPGEGGWAAFPLSANGASHFQPGAAPQENRVWFRNGALKARINSNGNLPPLETRLQR
jgi:hypothetical protein